MEKHVRVGVSMILHNNSKVLFGKRKNSHGDGAWAPPGGHLEFGEDPLDTAKRELEEETGLTNIRNLRIVGLTNDIFPKEDKHYITIHIAAEYVDGNIKIMEPEKCEAWEWFDWENLPNPLFLCIENLIKKGIGPYL